jgi:glycosyltransferase involved in cell wall biosynthesis
MAEEFRVSLAVVIPAYKTQFLRATLQSFADQTDRRFQIYIGDDASPEPVESVVREFSEKLPIRYHRFNENLGGQSLVRHWTRCLEQTTEPWLWLFSDDDFLEPGCVAAFYAALEKTAGAHDAYRFSTIEERDGGTATARPEHPPLQNGKDFLCEQLRGPHNSVMQEIIFSRAAWQRAGIPDFPLAWFADDAFIARLGAERPLGALAGPRLHWRLGSANISGDFSRAATRRKLRATARHARWAFDFLTAQKMERTAAAKLIESWYYEHVLPREVFLDRRCIADTMRLARDCWQQSAAATGMKLAAFNARLLGKKITRKLRR